jgi:Ca-activated chloride channel family protein
VAALVGATAVLLLAARLRARRRGRRLLGPWAPAPRGDLLPWLALLCLGIALVGPRLGTRLEPSTALGADVVLLFDTSRSMTARDNPPSRLHRARRAALELLGRLGAGDRVALAAFAGDGVLLTPLSRDLRALAELVPLVDDTLVGRAGSNLADGVQAALGAFGAERPRVLVLLSDGEDPLRRGVSGPAAEAARAGVRVVSLGFGSEDGSPVPDGDAALRDRRGREVVSRRDAEALARLAEMSDGAFFAADRWGELDVDAVRSAVRRDVAPAAGETVERRVAAVRVAPLAALAFALLALDTLGGLPRRRLALGASLLASLVLLGAASPEERALEAHLQARPDDARALVQLGIARAERGRHAEARRAFTAAALRARDRDVAATALYDLGVTALEQEDLEGARAAFLDAAALRPGHRRTLYNLEWTLAALASRPPPPAAARPRPEPDAEPRPHEPGPADAAGEPRPLTPQEARRWLESVEDDARRGLRSAGQGAPAPLRASREPAW